MNNDEHSWYRRWTNEYEELRKSKYQDIAEKTKSYKTADQYIRIEYVESTLRYYKDIDARMNLLSEFKTENYDKAHDRFYAVGSVYSHEFNRYHFLLRDLIKELEKLAENETMEPVCDFLQKSNEKNIPTNCTMYIFCYENKFREFGFLKETFEV